MADFATEKNKLISSRQIEKLTAIYDDYVYMVREYEQYMLFTPFEEIVSEQKEVIYPNEDKFPWKITPLDNDEQEEFAAFTRNEIRGKENRSYICLQHIKAEENNGEPPVFAITPYTTLTVGAQLPSAIERYSVSFPNDVTFGNTEFYIDGRYKAVYTGKNDKDKLLAEYIESPEHSGEFLFMLNVGECLRKNQYVEDDAFEKAVSEAYANERTKVTENDLLEIIGSFGERVKDICNEKYGNKDAKKNNQNDSKYNIIKAQKEGFMKLPKYFWDYVNLRNFMRHQWETLEEWEDFMPKTYKPSQEKRAERVDSYLHFCDKPIYLRLKRYIAILHQMQNIISEVNPSRIIRGQEETDYQFLKRLKFAYKKNPSKHLEAEINYPTYSDKFLLFKGDIAQISPDIRIADDTCETDEKFEHMFERMEGHKERSWFLQAFHTIECNAIGHCIRNGINHNKDNKNLTVYDAWDYLKDTGVMTSDEHDKWIDYSRHRRDISHYYFDEGLRGWLKNNIDEFRQDITALRKKLNEAGPIVTKQPDGTYKYTHKDGKEVILDHKRHLIVKVTKKPQEQQKTLSKSEFLSKAYVTYTKNKRPRKVYPNGVEIENDANKKITGIKLPNNVFINIEHQSIHWGKNTHWYENAQFFNALEINRSTVQTNKKLRVTEYRIGRDPQDFDYGDHLFIDDKHRVVIDDDGFIKKFDYKVAENKVIQAKFRRTDDGRDIVVFDDNTGVVFSGKDVSVIRNGKVLSFDNRDEIALSYGCYAPILPQQFIKHDGGR